MSELIIDVMKPLQENENLKTEIRKLEGLILSFRMKIRDEGMYSSYTDNEEFLKEYDEFFGITKERHVKALYPLTPDQCIQRYNAEHTDSQIFTRELTKEKIKEEYGNNN